MSEIEEMVVTSKDGDGVTAVFTGNAAILYPRNKTDGQAIAIGRNDAVMIAAEMLSRKFGVLIFPEDLNKAAVAMMREKGATSGIELDGPGGESDDPRRYGMRDGEMPDYHAEWQWREVDPRYDVGGPEPAPVCHPEMAPGEEVQIRTKYRDMPSGSGPIEIETTTDSPEQARRVAEGREPLRAGSPDDPGNPTIFTRASAKKIKQPDGLLSMAVTTEPLAVPYVEIEEMFERDGQVEAQIVRQERDNSLVLSLTHVDRDRDYYRLREAYLRLRDEGRTSPEIDTAAWTGRSLEAWRVGILPHEDRGTRTWEAIDHLTEGRRGLITYLQIEFDQGAGTMDLVRVEGPPS